MAWIVKQKPELLVRQGLDLRGKGFVVLVKGPGSENLHEKLPLAPFGFLSQVFD